MKEALCHKQEDNMEAALNLLQESVLEGDSRHEGKRKIIKMRVKNVYSQHL